MRVCPKCGYHEPEYWRVVRFNGLLDYTHLDNLQLYELMIYSELMKVQRGETVIIGDYAYHLIKNQDIVHKQWKGHYALYKWHGEPREHINHIPLAKRQDHITSMKKFQVKNQRRLFEANK